MLKIRRSHDRLIFNMEIPYLAKTVFILRRGPGFRFQLSYTANDISISNDMNKFIWGVNIHQGLNFNGALAKPTLNL